MERVMEYKLVEESLSNQLVFYVNMWIKDGWIPVGGMSVTTMRWKDTDGDDQSCDTFYQAMTKVEPQ